MPDEKLNELYKKSSESKELAKGWQNKIGDDYEYAVVYRPDGVEVVEAAKITTETLKGVLEIRAFKESGELHAVKRVDGKWAGRVRTDDSSAGGATTPVLDELHVLWGTEAHDEDDYIVLVEDRGTRLVLPKDLSMARDVKKGSEKESSERLALLVRNYLSAGDSFAFEDYRFVEFRIVEGR